MVFTSTSPVYIFPPSSIPVYENIFVLIVGGACVWSYINVLTLIVVLLWKLLCDGKLTLVSV